MLFVVDAQEGITAVDSEVAKVLRQSGKPVLVAANKVDSSSAEAAAAEAYALGFPDVFPRLGQPRPRRQRFPRRRRGAAADDGARAGRAAEQRRRAAESPASGLLRLAFIGKPNVGKSSLVNCLLGEERVLVHDQPGTTRDPIDTPFSFGGREYVLVDTAGMRRRRSIDTLTEHVAAKMARDQLDRCDVAALVIDAREGATAEDARLASLIEDSGRCAMVVLNKKDLVGRADIDARSNRRARRWPSCATRRCWSPRRSPGPASPPSWPRPPRRSSRPRAASPPVSSTSCSSRSSPSNRRPPGGAGATCGSTTRRRPRRARRRSSSAPTTRPEVGFPYRRFLINQLREAYGFEGTPIRLVLRAHRQKKDAPRREAPWRTAARRPTRSVQSRRK